MANDTAFLEWAASVSRDPIQIIRDADAAGRPVFGYLCTYVPEEIIYAAGILPVRIIGRSTKITLADQDLQTYCCSQVRSAAEDFLIHTYDNLKGVLFAHTCDTMQCFHEIIQRSHPDKFVHIVNWPSRLDMPAAFEFAVAEVKHFKEKLEKHLGKTIDPAALQNAVAVYNKNRELLDKLYATHAAAPDDVPSVALLHAVLASSFADKNEVNNRLEAFLASFKPSGKTTPRKKIIVVGSINVAEDFYNLTDSYGATVVDDDLCTGRRYFDGLTADATIESITRRYYERPHCPAKHRTNTSRAEYLIDLAKKTGASGVIFMFLKFCDPHSFDYPYLKVALDKAGLPSQLIEFEQSVTPSEQLRTKIQAFAEMLSAR